MSRRPALVRSALAALALLAAAGAGLPAQAAAVPKALVGRWVVVQVAADENDAIRRGNEPGDPRLMNAVLDILPDGSLDPASQDCKAAAWRARPATSLGRVVARNVRESSGIKTRPTLADYGLQSLGDIRLAPFTATCQGEPYDGGTQFASLPADRMLSSNGVDTVLVYQRVTPATPVKPSFSCAGRLGESESAICRSQTLAGLDRSVALAYQRARKKPGATPADLASLQQAQQGWLTERDGCKADEECLTGKMFDRITLLMQH